MEYQQIAQSLKELKIKQELARQEINKRTQYLESIQDLDLLVEGEDLIKLGTWGEVVYLRKKGGNLELLGTGHDGRKTSGAIIRIPLSELEIEDGKIIDRGFETEFFKTEYRPNCEQILIKTGKLY